ncbi:MAG TPA: protein tyrosine phosphatase [Verrucomicrobiae bacterium]|jgi:predicted protein tyrosine phosphatase|nr:protein tyrosine phosphatase [Verrucomicrobiae bacterium]
MRCRKVLFICSRNRWRSLTAEKIFDRTDGIQARSAGTEPGARIRVTAGHLSWADTIFVMEKKHLRRLQDKFPEDVAGKKVICLHIADDYEFMQPELVDLLQAGVSPYLNA